MTSHLTKVINFRMNERTNLDEYLNNQLFWTKRISFSNSSLKTNKFPSAYSQMGYNIIAHSLVACDQKSTKLLNVIPDWKLHYAGGLTPGSPQSAWPGWLR